MIIHKHDKKVKEHDCFFVKSSFPFESAKAKTLQVTFMESKWKWHVSWASLKKFWKIIYKEKERRRKISKKKESFLWKKNLFWKILFSRENSLFTFCPLLMLLLLFQTLPTVLTLPMLQLSRLFTFLQEYFENNL